MQHSKMNARKFVMAIFALVALHFEWTAFVFAETNADLIKTLQTLKPGDQSNRIAAAAIRKLNSTNDIDLLSALRAMKGATPIGKNWLSGLASSVYGKSKGKYKDELQRFLMEQAEDSEARYIVFEWLTQDDAKLRSELLAKMHNDSSPEIRHLAISEALAAKPSSSNLRTLLDSARHPDQVVDIIKRLKDDKIEIDQARHFGFLMDWKLIGPFDNVGTVNFDKVFPVESDWIAGRVQNEYPGKKETVQWKSEKTTDIEGKVNLATAFSKEKGCIVYAMTEFDSEKDQDADIRIGSSNGTKIWLNSKLIASNEVYHTGMQIDQYIEPVRLTAGKNRILVKISQNEQTEQWAQEFVFQLRICDSTGKAILAKGN